MRSISAIDRITCGLPVVAIIAWIACCAMGGRAGTVELAVTTTTDSAKPTDNAKSPLCHPSDEVWLVSTRCLEDCPDLANPPKLAVHRWQLGGKWTEASVDALLKSPAKRSLIWVHGNRISETVAIDSGWIAYHALRGKSDQPVRVIIWSWPSDKMPRPLRDIRVKACRTDTEAEYLGWLLAQFPDGVRSDLVGYSYGSRIITGALHLLAGGDLHGRKIPVTQADPKRHRVALLAGAIDCNWLVPGCYHGRAVEATESIFVTYNPGDRILKWYPRATGGSADALGLVGVCGIDRLGERAPHITQLNVSGLIGRIHDWQRYLGTPEITAAIRDSFENTESAESPTPGATAGSSSSVR